MEAGSGSAGGVARSRIPASREAGRTSSPTLPPEPMHRPIQRTAWRHQPALDGLRGLAVLAVVLYHAGVGWLPGGLLGVDAFFVLSGFLITGLMLAERRGTGRVDLKRFWVRRARRLLPALLLLLILVSVQVALTADPVGRARIRRMRWPLWRTSGTGVSRSPTRAISARPPRRPCCTCGRSESRNSSTCCGRSSSGCSSFAAARGRSGGPRQRARSPPRC